MVSSSIPPECRLTETNSICPPVKDSTDADTSPPYALRGVCPTYPESYRSHYTSGLEPTTQQGVGLGTEKAKRTSRETRGDYRNFLVMCKGVQEDISLETSFAPGRRLMLSEAEVEDESTTLQQEYAKLMENRDAMKRQWG